MNEIEIFSGRWFDLEYLRRDLWRLTWKVPNRTPGGAPMVGAQQLATGKDHGQIDTFSSISHALTDAANRGIGLTPDLQSILKNSRDIREDIREIRSKVLIIG